VEWWKTSNGNTLTDGENAVKRELGAFLGRGMLHPGKSPNMKEMSV
jgi:hypothetical protein